MNTSLGGAERYPLRLEIMKLGLSEFFNFSIQLWMRDNKLRLIHIVFSEF